MRSSKFPSPPRLAVWLVKHLDRYRTNHAIVDDMQEVFTRIYKDRGYILAFFWYCGQCLYAAEEKTGKIFTTFTFLALFLSCLGIFSLSSFVASRRTKEIGIRKVLGATAPKILGLISGEFVWLVMAANLIAWPVSYFVMRSWLGNFAYRIELTWTVFALATFIGLLIALATISFQSLKAALANPVDSLRYE